MSNIVGGWWITGKTFLAFVNNLNDDRIEYDLFDIYEKTFNTFYFNNSSIVVLANDNTDMLFKDKYDNVHNAVVSSVKRFNSDRNGKHDKKLRIASKDEIEKLQHRYCDTVLDIIHVVNCHN